MNEIALKLGLAENATKEEVLEAIEQLSLKASKVDTLETEVNQLKEDSITLAVDTAIGAKKITAEKRDHFISLGKQIGVESLKATFDGVCATPAVKPSTVLNLNGGEAVYTKLSEVPQDKLVELRKNNEEEYKRLYKAEYGFNL